VGSNICEQTFTSGSATFTPNAQMGKLEVLLVAGGGNGTNHAAAIAGDPGIPEYGPNGGGGGEVKIVNFSGDTSTPLQLTVGDSGSPSSVTKGVDTTSALEGSTGGLAGGSSGNGNSGWSTTRPAGAGAGAGASPVDEYNGGAGVTPSAIAPTGSLFSTDATCYSGGGAIAFHGGTVGTATCGAGYAIDDPTTTTSVVSPAANSGGGGGGGETGSANSTNITGASGVIVVRWNVTVTLTFASSHGSSVPAEAVEVGTAPVKPADPVVDHYVFKGWFTDPELTTPADFTAPLTVATTFYPSFIPTLATTGGTLNQFELPLGAGALGVGLTLAVAMTLRRRRDRRTV
jgi:hypothetical protein